MSQDTILDIDALLDSNLSQVENIPDFVTPPAGTYKLAVKDAKTEKYESKAKEGKPATKGLRLRITYEVKATVETKEPPVSDGSLFSENFMATEDGLKFFKKQAMKILNVLDLGDTNIRDILDGLAGVEFDAVITIRKSGEFENVNVRPIHETDAV